MDDVIVEKVAEENRMPFMRKVLVVIPHFYGAGNGFYGSTGSDVSRRVSALDRVIEGVHQSLGSRQAFLLRLQQQVPGKGNGLLIQANQSLSSLVDIAVCTTGENHLVSGLGTPSALFHHRHTGSEPMKLGFTCHQVLKENLGRYDWYCYLEDDLLITDALFMNKLEWFVKEYGVETTLAPQRFERSLGQPAHKLYHDGSVRPDFSAEWQDVTDRQVLESTVLGGTMRFERWPNPHSGCFFLTAAQMEKWVSMPYFGDGDSGFAGPLESAASLGIIKTFRQYKPSPQNAAFLELEHLHPRYLGEALKFS
jgi:hypothetical protein